MFAQASSNLISLLICFCDVPQPSQNLDVTVKPAIQKAIDIDSTQPYTLQVLNCPVNQSDSTWIYPEWMWGPDAIATKPSPLLWIPAETMSLNLDQVEQHGIDHHIGFGTLILGSPDANF